MKTVCSFLPAATTIIGDLQANDQLLGVTFECNAQKPIVVHSKLEGKDLNAGEISHLVSESYRTGEPLYYVNQELLQQLSPEIIFTQDVCDVCQIGESFTKEAVSALDYKPKIQSFAPTCIADIYDNIRTVSIDIGIESNGVNLINNLQAKVKALQETVDLNSKKILFLEWIDPFFNAGHWIPEVLQLAGGEDKLANPGKKSVGISWEKIHAYNPEYVFIGQCGVNCQNTLKEFQRIRNKYDWQKLDAFRNKKIFIIDGDLFTEPSTNIFKGMELIAHLLNPEKIQLRGVLSNHFIKLH